MGFQYRNSAARAHKPNAASRGAQFPGHRLGPSVLFRQAR